MRHEGLRGGLAFDLVLLFFKQLGLRSATMPQFLIRDLDAKVIARLKEQARENHRSLRSEVKAILEQAAQTATLRRGPGDHRQVAAPME